MKVTLQLINATLLTTTTKCNILGVGNTVDKYEMSDNLQSRNDIRFYFSAVKLKRLWKQKF